VKRLLRNPAEAALDVTPVIGVLAIVVVLLLRSFATDRMAVRPSADLVLPVTVDAWSPAQLVVNVVVTRREILVDGVPVVDLEHTTDDSGADVVRIPAAAKDGLVVHGLLSLLSSKALAQDAVQGRVTLHADRGVPFSVLREVMYTSALARFDEFRFVAIEGR
jgi:hypothetical protein